MRRSLSDVPSLMLLVVTTHLFLVVQWLPVGAQQKHYCQKCAKPQPFICGTDQIALADRTSDGSSRFSAIHGIDNRRDYYAANGGYKKLMAATLAVVPTTNLEKRNGKLVLTSRVEALAYSTVTLCCGETFCNQPTAAVCSGVLVGKRLLLTAAHCFKETTKGSTGNAHVIANVEFVLGYRVAAMDKVNDFPQLRSCKVKMRNGLPRVHVSKDNAMDWALVELQCAANMDVPEPMKVSLLALVKTGDDILATGYPSGIPVKLADDAKVLPGYDADKRKFRATLDVFRGGSGGGVFSRRKSGNTLLVGVLKRGYVDYRPQPPLNICSRACVYKPASPDYRGEEVTRITQELIDKIGALSP